MAIRELLPDWIWGILFLALGIMYLLPGMGSRAIRRLENHPSEVAQLWLPLTRPFWERPWLVKSAGGFSIALSLWLFGIADWVS